MRIEEIRRLMAEVGVEDEYVRNFEKYHGSKIDNCEERFSDMSVSEFSCYFHATRNSFNWTDTEQGYGFWRYIQVLLVLRNMKNEVELAKRAFLELKREGYVESMDYWLYKEAKIKGMTISQRQLCVAHCAGSCGECGFNEELYIQRCETFLMECGMFKIPKNRKSY